MFYRDSPITCPCVRAYTSIYFNSHASITVEPPNKGHFGNNINSAGLSLVERMSSSRRFSLLYGNYREGNILGPKAVSPIERSNIKRPFLTGSTV